MAISMIRGHSTAITNNSQSLTLTRPALSEEHDIMVACLYILCQTGVFPVISPPTGWATVATRQLSTQRTVTVFIKQIGRNEPTSYVFTTTGTLGTTYCFSGTILAFANASKVDYSAVNTTYTTSDTTIKTGAFGPTGAGAYAIFYGVSNVLFSSGPTNWNVLYPNINCSGTSAYSRIAVRYLASSTSYASVSATLSSATTVKHAIGLMLRPAYLPPRDIELQTPTEGAYIAPGTQTALTAKATDPQGQQVRFHYEIDRPSSTVVDYLGASAWANSGSAITLYWWPGTTNYGERTLSYYAENSSGAFSGKFMRRLNIYNAHMLLPADQSYCPVGPVKLTAKGRLMGSGYVAIQWEIDINNPPSSSSAHYQLLTSVYVAQETEASVMANCPLIRNWYVRARTVDLGGNPSSWSPIFTLHVLDGIRLLPGSTVERSTLELANKVIVQVDQSDPPDIITQISEEGPLPYSIEPHEVAIVAPEGTTTAGAVAIAQQELAKRSQVRTSYANIKVRLQDGLKLSLGQQVCLQVASSGLDIISTVRQLEYDAKADICTVSLGEFSMPKDKWDVVADTVRKIEVRIKEQA